MHIIEHNIQCTLTLCYIMELGERHNSDAYSSKAAMTLTQIATFRNPLSFSFSLDDACILFWAESTNTYLHNSYQFF